MILVSGDLYSQDYHAECNRCRVPVDCDNKDPRCGIRRGVKYGLYPKSALRADCSGLKYGWDDPTGFAREIPAFEMRDSMVKFSQKVISFYEPWMRLDDWRVYPDG